MTRKKWKPAKTYRKSYDSDMVLFHENLYRRIISAREAYHAARRQAGANAAAVREADDTMDATIRQACEHFCAMMDMADKDFNANQARDKARDAAIRYARETRDGPAGQHEKLGLSDLGVSR